MQTETQRKIENLRKIEGIQEQQLQDTRNILMKLEAKEAFIEQSIGRSKRIRTHGINIVYVTAKD